MQYISLAHTVGELKKILIHLPPSATLSLEAIESDSPIEVWYDAELNDVVFK